MIDPRSLLEVARNLLASGTSSEEAFRRSISTAYYAIFHLVLAAGADRLFGKKNRLEPGYSLLYRGYSHSRLKGTFKSLNVATLSPKLQRQLRTSSVSQPLRDFANVFVDLQERRHSADYDTQMTFLQSDAQDAVGTAELGFQKFKRVPKKELSDVLALMVLDQR